MRTLLLALALLCVQLGHAVDATIGLGPAPTNSTLLAPGPIGSTTPSSGAFTTLSATGQITSTVSGGTAPFVLTSNTVTPNLNAALLNGATFAAPGAIGGTTPGTGAFTTLSATGTSTLVAVNTSDLITVTEAGFGSGNGGVIAGVGTAGGNAGFRFRTGGTDRWQITTVGSAGAEAVRWYNIGAGAEAMRLTYGGSLIVGSTSDDGANLVQINGSIAFKTAGNGLKVKEGTNARMGTATLVGGTVTVANNTVTASTRIFLESNADGGTPGWLRVSARVAATSFTITSSSGTDTSTVAWLLVEPSP